jgi:ribosomal-protein-alanine N-acetyltransferase
LQSASEQDEPRVYLRVLGEDEITDEYVGWHNNQAHIRYYSSSGRQFSRELLLEEMRAGRVAKTLLVYGLYFRENGKLIGNLKVGPITRHRTSDLPVFIGDVDYLGKGLAVEAIRAGNCVAFDELDIRKLYGGIYRGNVGAVKAYTRAGWVIEGVLEGQYLTDGKAEDSILLACFSPRYFDVSDHAKRFSTVDDVYGK